MGTVNVIIAPGKSLVFFLGCLWHSRPFLGVALKCLFFGHPPRPTSLRLCQFLLQLSQLGKGFFREPKMRSSTP